jgi:hypothetical protein
MLITQGCHLALAGVHINSVDKYLITHKECHLWTHNECQLQRECQLERLNTKKCQQMNVPKYCPELDWSLWTINKDISNGTSQMVWLPMVEVRGDLWNFIKCRHVYVVEFLMSSFWN